MKIDSLSSFTSVQKQELFEAIEPLEDEIASLEARVSEMEEDEQKSVDIILKTIDDLKKI